MYPCINGLFEFYHPPTCLLKLQGIFSAENMCTPNNKDNQCHLIQYVIRHSLSMLTIIGHLTGFASHIHHYFSLVSNSVKVANHPDDKGSGLSPSCHEGSGSITINAIGNFVALLTSGTGSTNSMEIIFGTPIFWLWEIINAQFPGVSLYFEVNNT